MLRVKTIVSGRLGHDNVKQIMAELDEAVEKEKLENEHVHSIEDTFLHFANGAKLITRCVIFAEAGFTTTVKM